VAGLTSCQQRRRLQPRVRGRSPPRHVRGQLRKVRSRGRPREVCPAKIQLPGHRREPSNKIPRAPRVVRFGAICSEQSVRAPRAPRTRPGNAIPGPRTEGRGATTEVLRQRCYDRGARTDCRRRAAAGGFGRGRPNTANYWDGRCRYLSIGMTFGDLNQRYPPVHVLAGYSLRRSEPDQLRLPELDPYPTAFAAPSPTPSSAAVTTRRQAADQIS
jgi:hypothetical protein